MIVKTELVKKVKDYFDLNIYETKIWLALLSRGISSAGEVAEISGVPRSRTYDVLEGLEKRGFAIEKIGKPVKYLAVKPETVLDKLKNNTIKYAEEKVQVLLKLRDTKEFEELEALHKSGVDPIKNQDVSTSIKGRANLYTQIRELMESAKKCVYISTCAFELNSKQKMFEEVFTRLTKNNIDVKVMISDPEDEAKRIARKFNVSVKSKSLNARFAIADKKEIIFTMKPTSVHEDFDYGLWINSEYFSSALAYLFELAWKD